MSKRIPSHATAASLSVTTDTSEVIGVPPASSDDFAARIRHARSISLDALPTLPENVPTGPDTFAQKDLRKLDADLQRAADEALAELAALPTERRAKDLGPVADNLGDVEALLVRRRALRSVMARLIALVGYVEAQQRVADHDTILTLESVGRAVAFFARFDVAVSSRHGATLTLLAKRGEKIAEGVARARNAAKTTA